MDDAEALDCLRLIVFEDFDFFRLEIGDGGGAADDVGVDGDEVGAGSESRENNTMDGQPTVATRWIGPVSLPTARLAARAKLVICAKSVRPVRSIPPRMSARISLASGRSGAVPTTTGVMPRADNAAASSR